MKIFFLCIFILLGNNLSAQDLIEEKGYFTSPKAAYQGIIYTDNYYSKLYYTSGQNSTELYSSPGCGRYFSISPDKKYIGLKIINVDGKQQPAIYDLSTRELIKLYRPMPYCGQVSFGDNVISFSAGHSIVLYEDGIYRNVNIGTYSNIAPVSPDNKYVIFNDAFDQLWLFDISKLSKVMITDGSTGYFNPQWSSDGLNILYSSLSGELKIYNLFLRKTVEIGSGFSPSWSDEGKSIVYYKKNIENMRLINSDLYEYILSAGKSNQLTFTTDVFEMDPSYSNGQILFHTHEHRQIKMMSHSELSKSADQSINLTTLPLSVAFYEIPDNPSSMLDMPYVHQVYDTPNWFNGHAACGPTAAMNVLAYYNILPAWETSCSSPKPHINNWGRYVAEKYNFRVINYNFSASDPNGKASYGGYGYMWNGSKSPHSTMVNYYKNHGLSASLTDQPNHSEALKEIEDGYPYTMCVGLTSAGHIIAAHGIGSESHTLIVNDPYGNKNTPGYPSYDGKDARYDWPGYNNGFQNLAIVYWCVKNHGSFPTVKDSIVDDLSFANGFYLHTKSPSSMYLWKDMNKGYENHMWFTNTKSGLSEVCYATWRPEIPREGKYEISAFISLSNAEAAVYTIKHSRGIDTIVINQKAASNEWLSLGSYWFDKGTSNIIKLSDISSIKDQEIIFDAIRYRIVDTVFTNIHSENKYVKNFALEQNFPNPFNPITHITFTIPEKFSGNNVKLAVYNLLGEIVMILVNENKNAGKYTVEFNGSACSAGIYYYSLQIENIITTKKMILLP